MMTDKHEELVTESMTNLYEIDGLKEIWYSTKSLESAQASIDTYEDVQLSKYVVGSLGHPTPTCIHLSALDEYLI
jgi:hypothetical protein|tara:strand:- start:265 stop:489 length:225 start_codon:yes stop_codon:yes gene_type:complete